MPRANRYIVPGQIYHLTHRCHKQAFLLRFGIDRESYRKWLREGLERHGVSLLNYCITSNHVHLLMTNFVYKWHQTDRVQRKKYTCGYCGNQVGPDEAYRTGGGGHSAVIMICPTCNQPTFFAADSQQYPRVRLGKDVKGITDANVEAIYREARDTTASGAYTGAVLLCRKILMNISVQHGAKTGESFSQYIDFLDTKGFMPPNGKAWVDKIRQKGNEATHEIQIMTEADAQQILHFVEMLLRFVYEFPSMLEK